MGYSREPRVYPESFRWLPGHRTATPQSGSPPNAGRLTGTAGEGPAESVHRNLRLGRPLPASKTAQNGLGLREKLRIDMASRARFDVANEEVARRGILFSNISEKSRL